MRARMLVMKESRPDRSRRALVEAGAQLFATYGLRHTSMEAIAAEAGVAKTTAYAHFANKDEVFRAVVLHVSEQMIARAEAAADAAATPEAAVLASLASKQCEMFELLHRSRHASELLEAFSSVSGEQTEHAHDLYITALARRVARCPGVGKKLAPEVATLLDHAAYGLMGRAARVDELRRRLALLVERVVERRA